MYSQSSEVFCLSLQLFLLELFKLLRERTAGSIAESDRQVLTGVLLQQLWNELRVKQPASPGPRVNARQVEAKENVPEHQMEKELIVDKQVSHLGTCREQPVADFVLVNIWQLSVREIFKRILLTLFF